MARDPGGSPSNGRQRVMPRRACRPRAVRTGVASAARIVTRVGLKPRRARPRFAWTGGETREEGLEFGAGPPRNRKKRRPPETVPCSLHGATEAR